MAWFGFLFLELFVSAVDATDALLLAPLLDETVDTTATTPIVTEAAPTDLAPPPAAEASTCNDRPQPVPADPSTAFTEATLDGRWAALHSLFQDGREDHVPACAPWDLAPPLWRQAVMADGYCNVKAFLDALAQIGRSWLVQKLSRPVEAETLTADLIAFLRDTKRALAAHDAGDSPSSGGSSGDTARRDVFWGVLAELKDDYSITARPQYQIDHDYQGMEDKLDGLVNFIDTLSLEDIEWRMSNPADYNGDDSGLNDAFTPMLQILFPKVHLVFYEGSSQTVRRWHNDGRARSGAADEVGVYLYHTPDGGHWEYLGLTPDPSVLDFFGTPHPERYTPGSDAWAVPYLTLSTPRERLEHRLLSLTDTLGQMMQAEDSMVMFPCERERAAREIELIWQEGRAAAKSEQDAADVLAMVVALRSEGKRGAQVVANVLLHKAFVKFHEREAACAAQASRLVRLAAARGRVNTQWSGLVENLLLAVPAGRIDRRFLLTCRYWARLGLWRSLVESQLVAVPAGRVDRRFVALYLHALSQRLEEEEAARLQQIADDERATREARVRILSESRGQLLANKPAWALRFLSRNDKEALALLDQEIHTLNVQMTDCAPQDAMCVSAPSRWATDSARPPRGSGAPPAHCWTTSSTGSTRAGISGRLVACQA